MNYLKIAAVAMAGVLALSPAAAQKTKENHAQKTNELGQSYDSSMKVGNGVKSDKHAGTNFSDEAAKKGMKIGGRANSTYDQQHGPATWFGNKSSGPKVFDADGNIDKDAKASDVYAAGYDLFSKGETEKGLELMKYAADKGEKDAAVMLASCYTMGQGVPQDLTEAEKWIDKASAAGDNMTAFNMGVLYYNGQGVERNMVNAAKWFEKAARNNNPNAAYYAAGIYEKGTGGVAVDKAKAIELYEIAAKNGMTNANAAIERLKAE